jgi:hypothetical protein
VGGDAANILRFFICDDTIDVYRPERAEKKPTNHTQRLDPPFENREGWGSLASASTYSLKPKLHILILEFNQKRYGTSAAV